MRRYGLNRRRRRDILAVLKASWITVFVLTREVVSVVFSAYEYQADHCLDNRNFHGYLYNFLYISLQLMDRFFCSIDVIDSPLRRSVVTTRMALT